MITIVVVVVINAMDNCADDHNPDGVEGSGYFAGFTVYSPPSDGSCLFASLGHQLGRGFAAAEELRSELVDYIRETATEMVRRNFSSEFF